MEPFAGHTNGQMQPIHKSLIRAAVASLLILGFLVWLIFSVSAYIHPPFAEHILVLGGAVVGAVAVVGAALLAEGIHHRNERIRADEERMKDRQAAQEERERRIAAMRLLLATELAQHLAGMTPTAQLEKTDVSIGAELRRGFSSDDSEVIWRFCLYADALVRTDVYQAYMKELPGLQEQCLRAIVDAYSCSRPAVAEALWIKEVFIRPEYTDGRWHDRAGFLQQLCQIAVQGIRAALSQFPEGQAKLEEPRTASKQGDNRD